MESSDDTPSKLLTLPAELKQEIFDYLSPMDIIIFSFCSKGSFQVAKNVKKKPQKSEVAIDHGVTNDITISYPEQGLFLWFEANNKNSEENISNIKNYIHVLGNKSAKFVMETKRKLVTYWSDEVQGFVELVKHLVEVLGIVLISKVLTGSTYGKQEEPKSEELCEIDSASHHRLLLDWLVKDYKGEVSEMHINAEDLNSNSELIYFLDIGKIAKKSLVFHSSSLPNLEYQFNYTCDSLVINEAEWFNFDHLVQLSHQVRKLKIIKCSVTILCLNRFIKKWIKDGEDWKLKDLDLDFDDIDLNELLAGTEYHELDGDEYYSITYPEEKGIGCIHEGFVIERRIKNDRMIIPRSVFSKSLHIFIAPETSLSTTFFVNSIFDKEKT